MEKYFEKIQELTNYLLDKHGLKEQGWRFDWNNRKRALGLCNYTKKTIFLSKLWIDSLNEEEIIDIVLHEIAHAIAGPKAGHGPIWKRACISVGARPERLYSKELRNKDSVFKYIAICPICSRENYRDKIPNYQTACSFCSKMPNGKIKFNPKAILKYKINDKKEYKIEVGD